MIYKRGKYYWYEFEFVGKRLSLLKTPSQATTLVHESETQNGPSQGFQ